MIIDGKQIADKILRGLRRAFADRHIRLVGILVGDHPGSKKFLELKGEAARLADVEYEIVQLPRNISNNDLKAYVKAITKRKDVDGVLVELPLPQHIVAQDILNIIPLEKDVDALSEIAGGQNYVGRGIVLAPAAEAVKIILDHIDYASLHGVHCVVFGNGLLVGRPVAQWLAQMGATVTIINEFTKHPELLSREADIIISGVGKPGIINASMVKEGAIVIDFGYQNKDGKLVGDVVYDEVAAKASHITPVPGGVGPVVIAAVFNNLATLTNVI